MKTFKKIVGIVLFWLIGAIKAPFTLIGILGIGIEYILLILLRAAVKFSGSESYKEGYNYGMEINMAGCEAFSEEYEDLRFEP